MPLSRPAALLVALSLCGAPQYAAAGTSSVFPPEPRAISWLTLPEHAVAGRIGEVQRPVITVYVRIQTTLPEGTLIHGQVTPLPLLWGTDEEWDTVESGEARFEFGWNTCQFVSGFLVRLTVEPRFPQADPKFGPFPPLRQPRDVLDKLGPRFQYLSGPTVSSLHRGWHLIRIIDVSRRYSLPPMPKGFVRQCEVPAPPGPRRAD